MVEIKLMCKNVLCLDLKCILQFCDLRIILKKELLIVNLMYKSGLIFIFRLSTIKMRLVYNSVTNMNLICQD